MIDSMKPSPKKIATMNIFERKGAGVICVTKA